jgi:hypothetical protein
VRDAGIGVPLREYRFQRTVADDPTEREGDTCTICTRVHLINPKTGRVLGADEN